jgi:AcrR family transcriptional regulator
MRIHFDFVIWTNVRVLKVLPCKGGSALNNQEEQPGNRYTDYDSKCKLASKLMVPFRTSGFQQLRMDDIAKHMDISKVTLYKYFSSKDEVISMMVDQIINCAEKIEVEDLPIAEISYEVQFRNTFVKTLILASYQSDPFLKDLSETALDLYGKLESAIGARNERLRAFYEQGMSKGIFIRQNATLLILQDELILRHLLNPVYLMKHNLTLRDALFDYYLIKKRQLLVSPYEDADKDNWMKSELDRLGKKFMYGTG